ncbi:hypothetical protein KFE25_005301 [Diacronema lutheri]|uniref:Nuclear pore complex protein NUP96 C-terminal domain-containing protein n=2 Tax=Diacronema lutheri TaxID=2081491 RepID=A0A8J5XBQ8_DIALT|nr:hypothetical protein KFE25_005301 [Diacronema lutheri]
MVRFGLSLHDDDELDGDELGEDEEEAMQMIDEDDAMPTLLEASADDAEMTEQQQHAQPRSAPPAAHERGSRAPATPASAARAAELGLMRSVLRMRSAAPLDASADALAAALLAASPQLGERGGATADSDAAAAVAGMEQLIAMAARQPTVAPALVQPYAAPAIPTGQPHRSLCARILAERQPQSQPAAGARASEYALGMLGHVPALSWAADGSIVLSCLLHSGSLRGRPAVQLAPIGAWRTADGSDGLAATCARADAAADGMADGAEVELEVAEALGPARPVGSLGIALNAPPSANWRCEQLLALADVHRAHVAIGTVARDAEARGVAGAAGRASRVSALCDAYGAVEATAKARARDAAAAAGAPPAPAGAADVGTRAERLWQLVDALWGEHGCTCVRSEERVAHWLRALARDSATLDAGEPGADSGPLDGALPLLCALDVRGAARLVRQAGYPRLAALVSLCGHSPAASRGAARQLRQWEATGALSLVPAGVVRLHRVLAGHVLHAQARAAELAWPQALALCWWFMHGDGTGADDADDAPLAGARAPDPADTVPTRLLRRALDRYAAASHAGLLQPAIAAHVRALGRHAAREHGSGIASEASPHGGTGVGFRRDGGLGLIARQRIDPLDGTVRHHGAESPIDPLYGLLRLAAAPSQQPLASLLCPAAFSAHPLGAADAWHLHEALWRVVGLRALPLSSWRLLAHRAVAQLLAAGRWEAAAYVAAQASPAHGAAGAAGAAGTAGEIGEAHAARDRAVVIQLIRRHAGADAAARADAAAADDDAADDDRAARADADAAVVFARDLPHLALVAAGDGAAAERALCPRARACIALFDGLRPGAASLAAADVCALAHSAHADACGLACAVRAQLLHLLAARSRSRAHALVVGQLAPRVVLGTLLAHAPPPGEPPADGGGRAAAGAELRALLDAIGARSSEVVGWSGGGLVYAKYLQLVQRMHERHPEQRTQDGEPMDGLLFAAPDERASLERDTLSLLAALSRSAAAGQRSDGHTIAIGGPSELRAPNGSAGLLGGHCGYGSYGTWAGNGAATEAMLAQLTSLLLRLRALDLDEAGARGEMRPAYLSDDLVRVRLPGTHRLELAWRALDELLVLHSTA